MDATAVAILRQLDDQSTTWSNHHAASCTLLASLLNILRQREYTQSQLTNTTITTTSHASKHALPFGPRSLELLVHKQSLEMESVVEQLLATLKALQQVLDRMTSLEQQAEALVRRQTSTKTTTTTSTTDSTSEKDALYATARITPLQALEWTHRIRDMYHAEYHIKRAQLTQDALSQAMERYESLEQLYRQWSLQRHLDFGLEQEIKERLDTAKRIQDYANLTSR
ncbi:hypothetical protein BGZ73_006615 [Actinomortierella ambigua]|nr:hypothetical protein BGZ73_006615 [Actinomortierella ambigua]